MRRIFRRQHVVLPKPRQIPKRVRVQSQRQTERLPNKVTGAGKRCHHGVTLRDYWLSGSISNDFRSANRPRRTTSRRTLATATSSRYCPTTTRNSICPFCAARIPVNTVNDVRELKKKKKRSRPVIYDLRICSQFTCRLDRPRLLARTTDSR